MTTSPRKLAWLVLAAVLAAAGCGDAPPPAAPAAGVSAEDLGALSELLRTFGGRPPKSVADFKPHATAFAEVVQAVTSGACVYQYGAGLKPGSKAVLAHGKDAAAAGGPVLLQDGTVTAMTAAEFAAAPKAGPKS